MSNKAKIVLVVAAITVFMLTLIVSITAGLAISADADLNIQEQPVSVEEAKEIAFDSAGVTAGEVTVVRRKLINENGKDVYYISFYKDDKNDTIEYYYKVDANNGEIVEKSKKVKNYFKTSESKKKNSEKQEQKQKPDNNDPFIGVDKARKLALKDAGLTERTARITSIELKTGADVAYYEVDFESEDIEYEFDINARTGKILSREVEYLDDDDYDEYDD